MKAFLVAFTSLMAVVGLVAAMPAPQDVGADVRLPGLLDYNVSDGTKGAATKIGTTL
ncbi:hypothetical protein ASPFODRAFT_51649 [Aspergillus luchuensis CBS 106.47]|uniref:Uncharacterized protein n=1 Tax=Aspergillus luchuensis (strain CBS 106.47) TaxID=1137211 RepID=A0A1M3T5E1_ASPLC|nr:hypothetical protein ASPFODRAFT_51649 [Aspergillus luchuensis CBS 106.47]